MTAFDADQISNLLRDLVRRLAQQGVSGGIRVVGGSAIALMNPQRRATHDIDAVLAPVEPIMAAARDLADQRGLPPDWLNDAVKAYVPPVGSEDWVELIREGDLTVSIASAELLLAMKLYANRGRRDLRAPPRPGPHLGLGGPAGPGLAQPSRPMSGYGSSVLR